MSEKFQLEIINLKGIYFVQAGNIELPWEGKVFIKKFKEHRI